MNYCKNCCKGFNPKRKDTQYCSLKCSNAFRTRTWRNKGKERELRKTPRGRYHVHKSNAAQRNIAFRLTFEEWWSLWEPFWSEDNYGKYCMCRTNDEGAYELGNVRIDTWQNNLRESKGLTLL